MFYAFKKMITIWKVVCYTVLAIMLYLGITGADGMVELFKIKNPDPNGKEAVDKILIPSQIIKWTLITVITEIVDNCISLFERKKFTPVT